MMLIGNIEYENREIKERLIDYLHNELNFPYTDNDELAENIVEYALKVSKNNTDKFLNILMDIVPMFNKSDFVDDFTFFDKIAAELDAVEKDVEGNPAPESLKLLKDKYGDMGLKWDYELKCWCRE